VALSVILTYAYYIDIFRTVNAPMISK